MVEAEEVLETLDINSVSTKSIARTNFSTDQRYWQE